jgi:hypothetical protein
VTSYDFDPDVQKVFDHYAGIPSTNWREWLTLSREDFESLAVKLSGLSAVGDLFDRLQEQTTDPRSLSVDVDSVIAVHTKGPLVICHTSGTSGGHISDLKWFYLSDELVTQLWAPGMQAIFEASGLDTRRSAVIFVPSRTHMDGLTNYNGKEVIKVYSAEFSQRLVISLIRPHSYMLDEYKNAHTLQVISKMLCMDRISVVSAPFLTVLGWADLKRLRQNIEKSLNSNNPGATELTKMVKRMGVKAAALDMRAQLAEKLSNAVFIFSATAMTEREWATLRDFLHWERGAERVTNLYVGSEVGPFAASIGSNTLTMQVFPLTVPVIEKNKKRFLITRSPEKVGRLFVSRMHGPVPAVNIDTGDVITLEDQEGPPIIQGEVLRAGFQLKVPVTISPEVGVPETSTTFVGSYFDLEGIEIRNPRRLLACLTEHCSLTTKPSLVVKPMTDTWEMVVPVPHGSECYPDGIREGLSSCQGGTQLGEAIKDMRLTVRTVNENPVTTKIPRSELSQQVKKGELPKGVLKRWPLYVVVPDMSEDIL